MASHHLVGHQSLSMINRIYNRLARVKPRGSFVAYRLPDGRMPGEDLLREILGDERVDAALDGAEARPTEVEEAGPPALRLLK
ncbi:MAG: hypothetical protein LC667_12965 [Thioalkalivibrio sp.]|nr:hypothetical protein [Thioalkalivibrio sp.]